MLNGRQEIYTDYKEITTENVLEFIKETLLLHEVNAAQIQHLFEYELGNQPIINREKKSAYDNIVHNTVINHASEIVNFNVSYLLSQPIAYTCTETEDSEKVSVLNRYMYAENKDARDLETARDINVCGVSYRGIFPNPDDDGDSPFRIYRLPPTTTYVVKANRVGFPVIAAVSFVYLDENLHIGQREFTVYTKDLVFVVVDDNIVSVSKNSIGMIPIIEWKSNSSRTGAFEVVEDLLNAINVLETNRIESVEQTVCSFTVFENLSIDSEQYEELRVKGALVLKSPNGENAGKVYTVAPNLNQTDQQILVNSLWRSVLSITGLPSVGDGNTSDSSNNGAMIVRNGWFNAEARAKATETLWRESETQMLKVILKTCETVNKGLGLSTTSIKQQFMRRVYEDIATKSNIFVSLMATGYVSVEDAATISNITHDPISFAKRCNDWHNAIVESENERFVSTQGNDIGGGAV